MTPSKTTDIAVVGHFSIDCLKLPSCPTPYAALGGAVAYVSLVARVLKARSLVVSKIGWDFPDSFLQRLTKEKIDVSAVSKAASERTTSFELTYSKDLSSRKLKLRNQGSPLTAGDFPEKLNAKVIHIAPIAGEVSFEVFDYVRDLSGCISVDPQGLMRRFDVRGNVVCSALDKRILPLVDIYKSSLEEAKVLTGHSDVTKAVRAIHRLGPKVVIVTMGAKGSVLYSQREFFEIPSYRSNRVVDPTGAGDVFIGAFLAEYNRREDVRWCACVGSAAASLAVEGVGTTSIGNRAEILRRARAVYEKDIKQ